jgi:hypothetical protein
MYIVKNALKNKQQLPAYISTAQIFVETCKQPCFTRRWWLYIPYVQVSLDSSTHTVWHRYLRHCYGQHAVASDLQNVRGRERKWSVARSRACIVHTAGWLPDVVLNKSGTIAWNSCSPTVVTVFKSVQAVCHENSALANIERCCL